MLTFPTLSPSPLTWAKLQTSTFWGGELTRVNQPPLPFTPSPSPVRNMPVLDVCLEMGETEAQVKGGAVPGLGWVLKIQQLIPCLWAPPGLMDGSQRGGRLRPYVLGLLFFWPLAWFFPHFPLCFCFPFEGEVMNLCKRVGLPWGLPCSEVHLYCTPAAMLEMRKWRCVRPIPFCLCLPSQCPLTTSSGGN